MYFFIALGLALVLACVAGVQYFYLLFLETRARQQRRRIAELERINLELAGRLEEAEARLARAAERDGESWPEVIDGDGVLR